MSATAVVVFRGTDRATGRAHHQRPDAPFLVRHEAVRQVSAVLDGGSDAGGGHAGSAKQLAGLVRAMSAEGAGPGRGRRGGLRHGGRVDGRGQRSGQGHVAWCSRPHGS